MTIPVWPDSLPRPERDTWSRTRQDARRKSPADAGPPRYQRRLSAVAQPISLSILVDADGKAVFDRFFDVTTDEGTKLFWMPDATADGWALCAEPGEAILIDDETMLLISAQMLCAFGDQMPVETIVGVEFRINFSVMVMP